MATSRMPDRTEWKRESINAAKTLSVISQAVANESLLQSSGKFCSTYRRKLTALSCSAELRLARVAAQAAAKGHGPLNLLRTPKGLPKKVESIDGNQRMPERTKGEVGERQRNEDVVRSQPGRGNTQPSSSPLASATRYPAGS